MDIVFVALSLMYLTMLGCGKNKTDNKPENGCLTGVFNLLKH